MSREERAWCLESSVENRGRLCFSSGDTHCRPSKQVISEQQPGSASAGSLDVLPEAMGPSTVAPALMGLLCANDRFSGWQSCQDPGRPKASSIMLKKCNLVG